jgi:thiamine biosynthesis lipoprotein
VSVIDDSCARADGLATALMVLGPDQGYNLAEKLDIPALFLIRQNDGDLEERTTSAFQAPSTVK